MGRSLLALQTGFAGAYPPCPPLGLFGCCFRCRTSQKRWELLLVLTLLPGQVGVSLPPRWRSSSLRAGPRQSSWALVSAESAPKDCQTSDLREAPVNAHLGFVSSGSSLSKGFRLPVLPPTTFLSASSAFDTLSAVLARVLRETLHRCYWTTLLFSSVLLQTGFH